MFRKIKYTTFSHCLSFHFRINTVFMIHICFKTINPFISASYSTSIYLPVLELNKDLLSDVRMLSDASVSAWPHT